MEHHLETDIDYNLDDPNAKSGVLQIRQIADFVMMFKTLNISVCEYLHANKFSQVAAQDFLFDPENVFFDYVSDSMGYEPDALRERIKKQALDRARKSYKQRSAVGQGCYKG
jgi:hypothetical protein